MWVQPSVLEHRIDAGYYQPKYLRVLDEVRSAGKTARLGNIAPAMCNGPHGGVEYVDSTAGVRYVRAKDLQDLTVTNEDPVFISLEDHNRHKRAELRPGDVLVTITGAYIGSVAVVPSSLKKANLIQSLGKVRVESGDDPHYVAAFLASEHGQALIRRQSVNTAREGLNFDYLSNVEVLLPSDDAQKAIGRKVEKAQRLRELLAEVMQSTLQDMAGLVEGTLDTAALIVEGREIETWLAENPCPSQER